MTTDPQTTEPDLTDTQKAYNVAQSDMFQLAAYGHHRYHPLVEALTDEGKRQQRDYNNRLLAARDALEAALLHLVAEHAETTNSRFVSMDWLRALADDPGMLSLLAVRPDERDFDAVPAPPVVRPELRDQIAEALMAWAERNNNPKYAAARRPETVVANAYSRADAVLDALPQPAEEAYRLALSQALRLGTGATWEAIRDRAEDLVAEVAELAEAKRRFLAQQQPGQRCTCGGTFPLHHLHADTHAPVVEAQQQTETEAHPAEHTWAAELHDPLADEWVPGTRYPVRERAVNALEHAKTIGPTWKDGAPTQRRLVRMTTTYTVEQPAVVAAVAGEEPAEVMPHTMLGAAGLEEKLDLNITPLTGDALNADEAVEEPDGGTRGAEASWPRRAWDLGMLHKGGDPHHCPACLKQPEPPANFVCPGDNTEVLANPQPAEEA